MKNDFNAVQMIGNLCEDPQRANNNIFVNFRIALNRGYKDQKGNEVEEVSFISCKCSGKIGDNVMNNCKKGTKVWVNGRLEQNRWTNNEGKKRDKIYVFVKNMRLIAAYKNIENSSPQESFNENFEESNL